MVDYSLLPNEGVLLKNESVWHPIGKRNGNIGELILTNLNLIYLKKSAFGGIKEVLKLNQIKIIDDNVQVIISKSSGNFCQMELFFINSHEVFIFNSLIKKQVLRWADKISELLTGHEANIDPSERNTIPGFGIATDLLKNTIGTFKEALKEKENVTNRCISCGAPLSGIKGEVKKCKYCGVKQTLK